MSIVYGTVTVEEELHQILSLQQSNHATTLSHADADRNGFVTVMHSFDLLKQMNATAPQIIAKDRDNVIGYALVMLKSFGDLIPVLQPMVNRLATIQYGDQILTDYSFYIMGQICIHEDYRGKGVFDALYHQHRALYQSQYELCITSVSLRNKRSMRAHERVGFTTVHSFQDSTDEWNILAWRLKL